MYDFVNPQLLHSKHPEKFLPIIKEFRRPFSDHSRVEKCDDDDDIYAVVGESE